MRDFSKLRMERHSREIGKGRGIIGIEASYNSLSQGKVVDMKWRKKIKRRVYYSFRILATEKIKLVGWSVFVWSELCSENQTTMNRTRTRTVTEWKKRGDFHFTVFCPGFVNSLQVETNIGKRHWERW